MHVQTTSGSLILNVNNYIIFIVSIRLFLWLYIKEVYLFFTSSLFHVLSCESCPESKVMSRDFNTRCELSRIALAFTLFNEPSFLSIPNVDLLTPAVKIICSKKQTSTLHLF